MFPLLSPHFSHCDCTISYVRQSRQKAETTPSHPTGMPLTSCTPARHHRRECRPQQGKKPVPPTGFPRSLVESTCNAGDLGPIPGLGRFPGEGNGNPPQYSCLENPMDRGAWRPAVHGVARGGHSTLVTPPPPPVESLQRPLRAELSTVAAGRGRCWGPGRSGGLEAA